MARAFDKSDLELVKCATDAVSLHHFALQAALKLGARHMIASKFMRDARGEFLLVRLVDTITWQFEAEDFRLNPGLQDLLIEMVSSGRPYQTAAVQAGDSQKEFDEALERYCKATGCTNFLTVPVMDSGVVRGFACYFAEHVFSPQDVKAYQELGAAVYARMLELGLVAPLTNPLTRRQCEVLSLCAGGKSDADIGEALGIAATTAHDHIEEAKRRLNVRTRIQAAVIAVRNGWVTAC